jgi:secreted trypsin-like serine protease
MLLRWITYFELQFTMSDCGTALDPATPLIINGEVTKRNSWPWHASIFRRLSPSSPFRYICGGTLIKPLTYNPGFVILSAAHCFATESGESPNGADYKVVLGSETSLSMEANAGVPNAQFHNVSKNYGTFQILSAVWSHVTCGLRHFQKNLT